MEMRHAIVKYKYRVASKNNCLYLKKQGETLERILLIQNISYIEADREYKWIVMNDGTKHLHRCSFIELVKVLPKKAFKLFHRSHLINTSNASNNQHKALLLAKFNEIVTKQKFDFVKVFKNKTRIGG